MLQHAPIVLLLFTRDHQQLLPVSTTLTGGEPQRTCYNQQGKDNFS
jgi:hypothetical protein